MKRILLLFVLIFHCLISKGQKLNVDVNSFPIYKLEERSIPLDILGFDSTGYYILYGNGKYGNKENSILKFNLNLTPTGQKINVLNTIEEPDIKTAKFIKIDNELFHVLVKNEAKSKTYFYEKINLKTFTRSSREFLTRVVISEGNMNKSSKSILVSPDGERIAIIYTLPVKNDQLEKIEVVLFNKSFDQIEKNTYEFSFISKKFLVQDATLSNDGSIYLLTTKTFSTSTISDLNNKAYKHILYKLDKKKPQNLGEIMVRNHHLRQIAFVNKNNKSLLVSGFYSDKDLYSIKGVFYFRLDLSSGIILQNKFTPFNEEYFTETLDDYNTAKTSKKFRKGKLEDKYMVIQKMLQYENGDIGLIAEQMYSYTVYGATTYYHMDLAVVRVNLAGEIVWAKKIAKENSKSGSPIYSYNTIALKSNNVLIGYNDNIFNLNHTKGEIVSAFSEGTSFIFLRVDSTGNYQRNLIKDERFMEGLRIRPNLSIWIGNDTLLIFAQNRTNVKTQRFFKLEFKENDTP